MCISLRAVGICALAAGLTAPAAQAVLNFNPAIPALNRSANLVTNGSFENGGPGSVVQFWATGTASTPFGVPAGWSSSGPSQNYATWGNQGAPRIRDSDVFPDGENGLYFGNLFTDIDMSPNFLPSGRVTFPGNPTFTPQFGAPVVLSQTVNTQLSPAPSYRLSFWVSGEDASLPTNWQEGIMGFRMTNVLPGDPMQYLSIPSDLSAQPSRLYKYDFVPLNPLLPVQIEFYNWGHVTSIAGNGVPFTTELVLDDVIVNTTPEPTAAAALGGLGSLALLRRRR